MKKLLSIIMALILGVGGIMMGSINAGATGPIDITTAFSDPNFRAEVYKAIGKTAPAAIYDTDVARVMTLNLRGKNIQSLAGLQFFIDLEYLGCSKNKLTSLPVLPPNLKKIYCYANQLTSIDVTGVTALELLNCSGNYIKSKSDIRGLSDDTKLYFDRQKYEYIHIWGVCTDFPKDHWFSWFALIALGGWAWMWLLTYDNMEL